VKPVFLNVILSVLYNQTESYGKLISELQTKSSFIFLR